MRREDYHIFSKPKKKACCHKLDYDLMKNFKTSLKEIIELIQFG
jgi:hypothetical protein